VFGRIVIRDVIRYARLHMISADRADPDKRISVYIQFRLEHRAAAV
jgi:hypothetical protein